MDKPKLQPAHDSRMLDKLMMQRRTRAQAASRAACAACHRRKVRCDAHDVGMPCSNCRAASTDDCRIHQKRKRASRSTRMASPEALTSGLVNPETDDADRGKLAHRAAAASPVTVRLCTPASADAAASDPDATDDGQHLCKRHLVEFIDQPELAERPIDSKARLTYIGTDMSNINFLVRQQYGPSVTATDDVCHFPTNRIASRQFPHGSAADPLPLDALQLPSRATVDELLSAYFRHVNPGFPVVDEQIFLQQYKGRDPSNPPSLVLLQSILVAGAHVLYHDQRDKRNTCMLAFFRRAKTLLDVGFERNRDTIVQAALLLTWHTDGLEDVTANAWHWIGVASRTAMGLGMHRDADGSTLVPHNKRMWRRVWWLLFRCDLWISLQYGRPPSIHLDDCSVQPLRRSDFQGCGDQSQPDYMIQMSLLAAIVSRAVRTRLRSSGPESRAVALQKADQELANWALHLPQEVRVHNASATHIWSSNLHLHYNTALILLHRAPPHVDLTGAHGPEESIRERTDICVAAAGTVQSLFESLRGTDSLKCLWTSSINCLFTALIQLSTEIRTTNPLLTVSALGRYDSALESLRELSKHWANAESILHFFEKSTRFESPVSQVMRAGSAARSAQPPVAPSPTASRNDPSLVTVGQDYPQVQDGVLEPPETGSRFLEAVDPTSDLRNGGSLTSGQPDANEADGLLDAWKLWQQHHWHTPQFTDEFLFTF